MTTLEQLEAQLKSATTPEAYDQAFSALEKAKAQQERDAELARRSAEREAVINANRQRIEAEQAIQADKASLQAMENALHQAEAQTLKDIEKAVNSLHDLWNKGIVAQAQQKGIIARQVAAGQRPDEARRLVFFDAPFAGFDGGWPGFVGHICLKYAEAVNILDGRRRDGLPTPKKAPVSAWFLRANAGGFDENGEPQ